LGENLWHWQRRRWTQVQAQILELKIKRQPPKLRLRPVSHQKSQILQQTASRQERRPRHRAPALAQQAYRPRLPPKPPRRPSRTLQTNHRNPRPMWPLSPHLGMLRLRNRSEVGSAQQSQHLVRIPASKVPPLLRPNDHGRGRPHYQARRGTSQQLLGPHEAESAARPQQRTGRPKRMERRTQTGRNGGPQGHSARPPRPMPRLSRSTSRRSRWPT